ncbi:MAG: hypothetical protein KC502_20985 [Myxococcales bacterium]|nr:hypothetical protein [Myxococcales bacterium]
MQTAMISSTPASPSPAAFIADPAIAGFPAASPSPAFDPDFALPDDDDLDFASSAESLFSDPNALSGWRNSVHRFRSEPRSARCARENHVTHSAGTVPPPPLAAVTTAAWKSACDVWTQVSPDDDDMDLCELSEEQLDHLLAAFGLPTDLDVLTEQMQQHCSARQWLLRAAKQDNPRGILLPAAHAFITEHAPALWQQLDPARPCLELIHGWIWHDMVEYGLNESADQMTILTALLALLPEHVRTIGAATTWLGQDACLEMWLGFMADHQLDYACSDDTESFKTGIQLFDLLTERFTSEPQAARDHWHVGRLLLIWWMGDRTTAEAGLDAFNQANPESVKGRLALACGLSTGIVLGQPGTEDAKVALALLHDLESCTDDQRDREDIIHTREHLRQVVYGR